MAQQVSQLAKMMLFPLLCFAVAAVFSSLVQLYSVTAVYLDLCGCTRDVFHPCRRYGLPYGVILLPPGTMLSIAALGTKPSHVLLTIVRRSYSATFDTSAAIQEPCVG